jgi:hypothetical protein
MGTQIGKAAHGDGVERQKSPRAGRRLVWATAVIALAPVVIAGFSVLGRHWYASVDWATEVSRIGDVGGSHTPLVGVPSRFGWYHPGPLIFWMLAPAYRLFGETGVLAGTAALNGVAIVGVIIVAHRRGGGALVLWVGVLVALLMHSLGLTFLIDPWNPWLAVLPFLCFVLLAWSVACGDAPALPWAVGVGTFVVQTHVGYVPLVVGLTGVALVLGGIRIWRRDRQSAEGETVDRRVLRTWLPVTAAVVVALWLAPVVQQLSGHPGNLSALVHFFRDPGQPSLGWTQALGIFGTELATPGPWLTAHDTDMTGLVSSSALWPALLVLAATAVAGALAWWRRAIDAALLAALAIAAAGLGMLATSQLTGAAATYLLRWWWVIALGQWLALGWCTAQVVRSFIGSPVLASRNSTSASFAGQGAHGRPRALAPLVRRLAYPVGIVVLLIGLVAVVATTISEGMPVALPQAQNSRAVSDLVGPTADGLKPHRTYVVDSVGGLEPTAIATGLVVALDLRGLSVYAQPGSAGALGTWHTGSPSHTSGTLTVVGPTELVGRWPPPPGSRLIARYDPLRPGQRHEADKLLAQIRTSLGGDAPTGPIVTSPPLAALLLIVHGAPRSAVVRLASLQAAGPSYLVYLTT